MSERLDRFQRAGLLFTALAFSSGYTDLGLLLMLSAVVWEAIVSRRIPWQRSLLDVPLLSFVVAYLISGLFSSYRLTAIGSLILGVITIYLGYGVLFRVLKRNREFLTPFLQAWFVGGVFAAMWASVSSKFAGQPAVLPELYQNSLATAMVIGLVLGLCWLDVDRLLLRAFAALGLTAVATAILLTNARGAWVASAVGLVSYLLLARQRRAWRTGVLVLVLGLAAVFLAGTGASNLIVRAQSIYTLSAPSNRVRLALADSAVAMLKDHPIIGTGLNTFSLYHARYPSRYYPGLPTHSSAHNIFFNMAAEGGILGLAAFTWIILITLRAAWRWYAAAPLDEVPLVGAVLASFIALLVNQQFEATIVSVHLGAGFWLLIAIQSAFGSQSIAVRRQVRIASLSNKRPSILY